MRIARIETSDGPKIGEYVDGHVETDGGETFTVGEDATLLSPCIPSALYCAGRNYHDYLKHTGNERPNTPHFFLKPPAALLGTERTIPYPNFADGVGYAGELAAVIGTRSRQVDPEDALDCVRGYTIMNDLDALGQEGAGKKVFEAGAPLGPWIETDIQPQGLSLQTRVGGELRQEGVTDEMLFSPRQLISFLSHRITLKPGDVIAFGSPANPGEIPSGESVEIWYEGIGTLRNDLGYPDPERS